MTTPVTASPNTGPRLRLLSLGAGVQSSTALLLACDGVIPTFDYALFADPGWEPAAVYKQVERLRAEAARHGIPVVRLSAGNIRRDALNPEHRFVSMPLFSLGPNGERGMARRQCTGEYKIKPLKAEARRLLGFPHPVRVPVGVYAEQAIGISLDEVHRAKDSGVKYLKNVFPLLDLGWTREDCRTYLEERGWGNTPRSACVGCPYHRDDTWRTIRDGDPDAWADVIAFDKAIRHGHPHSTAHGQPLRGTFYLHHSRVPLDQADLDRPVRRRTRRSTVTWPPGPEEEDQGGCSPWACHGSTDAADTAGSDGEGGWAEAAA